jgi:hypothetical protein
MARKLRYGIYDTARHVWLRQAILPTGDGSAMVTEWTQRPEKALRFPGVKSAEAMLEKLGGVSAPKGLRASASGCAARNPRPSMATGAGRCGEFVIVNGKGEIVA